MLTKGEMIKRLKKNGIRFNELGKKLEKCKTFEIINLYFDKGLGDSYGN